MKEIAKELYAATETTIQSNTYPGYPTTRLVIEDAYERDDLTLPDGPWTTRVMTFPSIDEQEKLRKRGYELDTFGRPLHPWLRDMLSNPDVGVVTGTGEYWYWGPNKTADPIIITNEERPRILLIQRGDTKTWALPGGFGEDDEAAVTTATREAAEEAGVILSGKALATYDGAVADARTTAHAWAETAALLWRVDHAADLHYSDDAINAKWFPLDDMPRELHGSHAVLIEQAAARLSEAPVGHIASLGEPLRTVVPARGGHMGYDRSLATTVSGNHYFIKRHDDSVFTDELKRSRSELYLQKEHQLYEHLQTHAPHVIPKSVRLVGKQSLVMEGLTAQQGWQWRAPQEHTEQYINNTITNLLALESVPIVPEPFARIIKPSYVTHLEEGWQSVDTQTIQKIAATLRTAQMHIQRPELQNAATQLTKDLPTVQRAAANLPEPHELVFTHHDLRQANIAWHPDHGTKIVDWSWAGPGRKHSDTTTLLIDLHKYGHDVSNYMKYFNNDHALTLIGFWLVHSILPSASDDNGVRFQQLLSSVSAYDLLMKNRQR